MVAGEVGTPPKSPTTRIARVALEALAFPSKWTGFGALSAQAIKDRQHGLEVWVNGVLDLVAEDVSAGALDVFLRPVRTVEAVWTEPGPLGVNFAKDLTVLATSPTTQRTHPQLVPGLELISVQNVAVVGSTYEATLGRLRTAGRPLTLVLVDKSAPADTTPRVDRVEVTDASSGSDESGKEFVLFDVRCFSSHGDPWVLTKRFSEFSALRDGLLRDAAEASPPSGRAKGLLQLGTTTTLEPSIALYVCVRKTIARTNCELDSEPLQAIYEGDELEVLEIRDTGEGCVRVRCRLGDAALPCGWCTATNKDGLVILEQRSLARVVRVTITDAEHHHDDTQQYVSYAVNCQGDDDSWTIAKRFSDFTVLQGRLVDRGLAELANEQFPSKVLLFGRRDDSVVERRKSALQRWVNKLLDWTHDDFELQRFLQDDGSWPPQPQVDQNTCLPPQFTADGELSIVDYYCSSPDRESRQELPLIAYYKRADDAIADRRPTGLFGGVFESGIFSRIGSGSSTSANQETRAEPEPEPEPAQEHGSGITFIHSVLDRFSAFDKPTDEQAAAPEHYQQETLAGNTGGATEYEALDKFEGNADAIDDNAAGERHQPLISVKRLKVASYQMRTDEKKGKEFTVYQIKCFPVDELATAPWVVSRRFSAFSDLRETLGSAIAKIPFPSRHMSLSLWGSAAPSSADLDERRLELEAWLISVLGLRQHDERVLRFLNPDAAGGARPALPPGRSNAKQSTHSLHTTEIGEATVGVQDSKDPSTPIGVYRCVRRTVVRESCEGWSEKLGILEEGVEVKVLEERLNEDGVLRARFVSTGVDLMGGWCSVRTASGQTILDLTFRQ